MFDELARAREPIVVTKRGKPAAKVVPILPLEKRSYFGYIAGTVTITGDIVSPIDESWSAITGDEDEFYDGIGAAEDGANSDQ